MTVYVEPGTKPHIQWNHVDGPMLHTSTANCHWLTLWERLMMKAGLMTIEELDAKHRYNDEPCRP